MKHKIPLNQVKINPRMRKDLGDLTGLMDSIARNGLIQPIVLSPSYELIAGERRYRAHEKLRMETIDFVFADEVPADVRAEMEFEENFWRKAMTWQEEALGILDIFRKKKTNLKDGKGFSWGQKEAAEMFGMSVGSINYVLVVARRLEAELKLPTDKRKYHQFQSVSDAYRNGILAEEEMRLNEELARRTQKETARIEPIDPELLVVKAVSASPDRLAHQRKQYESNPLNTIPFEVYWKEREVLAQALEESIYLSNMTYHGDCVAFMNDPQNAGRFDHIVTDPPYGIDMDNLDQNGTGMSTAAISTVRDAHHVEENEGLLQRFFPAAFACTNEKAFVITYCDVMQWQLMYDAAIKAGFNVQRWPLVWRKVNQKVGNSCIQYNTTKDYEILMVCRKPGAVLVKPSPTSIFEASNVEAVVATGHPFAKPYSITAALVEMVSLPGQAFLEPFAGGGSIALEILRQRRHVISLEKEAHHFGALVENLKREYFLKVNPNYKFK